MASRVLGLKPSNIMLIRILESLAYGGALLPDYYTISILQYTLTSSNNNKIKKKQNNLHLWVDNSSCLPPV